MNVDSTNNSNPYGSWWTTPDGIKGKESAFSTALSESQQITKDNQENQEISNQMNPPF